MDNWDNITIDEIREENHANEYAIEEYYRKHPWELDSDYDEDDEDYDEEATGDDEYVGSAPRHYVW